MIISFSTHGESYWLLKISLQMIAKVHATLHFSHFYVTYYTYLTPAFAGVAAVQAFFDPSPMWCAFSVHYTVSSMEVEIYLTAFPFLWINSSIELLILCNFYDKRSFKR